MAPERRTPFRAGGIPRGVPLLSSTGPQVLMVDVSEFQPNLNDAAYLSWSKAAAIRAMYGDAHDDGAWYGGARRADLWAGGAQVVFIYQYLVAWQDAAAQAEALVRLLGPLREGEMPVCDLEEGGGGQAARLAAWRGVIHKAYPWLLGTPSGHAWSYSGQYFALAHGFDVDWLADYTSAEPTVPAHKLWQFTDAYPVPGVGMADCSRFDGTIAGLRALITPKPAPQPPPPVPALTAKDDDMYLPSVPPDTTIPILAPAGCKTIAFSGGQPGSAPAEVVVWFSGDHAGATNPPLKLSEGGPEGTVKVTGANYRAFVQRIDSGTGPVAVQFY